MKRTRLFALIGIPLLAIGAYFLLKDPAKSGEVEDLIAEVKEAPLPVTIHAPGELLARRSEKIKGPDGLRTVGLYQVTIANLVPEGTVVQQGQFIASLDRTEMDGKIKESQTEIDKIVTQLDQAKIDTAIEMRSLRDQLVNIRFSMKEKELSLELSRYEPEAIKQQAKLDLERSQRELSQLENKLTLTKEKSIAQIEEINASYRQQEFKLNRLMELQSQMTVTAPKSGMVIYARDWNGKRGPGSQVSSWDPVIAELPDLSEMITKAYINEVDITKVIPGQKAKITVDAFPGKEFSGMILTKANIGEQVRNFDTKVFEVIILLSSIDSLLRPAMTTGISILTDSIPTCLQVPLEAIQVDSVSFVYKKTKSGYVRQEVVTGSSNDISICIAAGLQKGEQLSLNAPETEAEIPFVYLDATEKVTAKAKMESELAERMKIQNELAKTVKADDAPQDQDSGGTIIIF
ncbi:MAG: efflux RND transporter periplasmic adaptor subunit [Saprospiraceae bacterium]|nr:efflux RND transporter periplasmic adaptor subunit [Saprospiraceae bacterium]MBP8086345.1 efflux RND transporter periplasmic adaptor subunit [Saprospiraceae bacterium]